MGMLSLLEMSNRYGLDIPRKVSPHVPYVAGGTWEKREGKGQAADPENQRDGGFLCLPGSAVCRLPEVSADS